jgi:hypothetical protein
MAIGLSTVISFIVSWIVSSIVIYVATMFLGEKKGIGTAFVAALVGSIVYIGAFILLGDGTLAAIGAGIVWLIALGTLYNIGWIKAFVTALVIWIITLIVGMFLPTLTGPL